MKRKRSEKLFFILSSVILLPLILTVFWSFSVRWRFPDLIPQKMSLYGWNALVRSGDLRVLASSVLLSLCVSLLTLLIAFPAAKALSYDFKGKRFFDTLVFMPVIIPVTAISMGIHTEFIKMGLAYSAGGVILLQIFPCLPYAVRILKNVFGYIGDDLENQSRLLGASWFQTMKEVTVPLIFPGIMSAFFMVFVVSFSEYFITLLIGGGLTETFAIRMFPYLEGSNRTVSSAYVTVFTSVTVLFLLLTEKALKKHYRKKVREYFYV